MVNFQKLKALIREKETSTEEEEKRTFYYDLKAVADKEELGLRQDILTNY